ncbi:DMT family transporter [Inediibacterium massiliense]|uniref:DMT family transporter n=1 Tax=Inediibacterium massiliense TaxID=1658111 RepID=UPI000DA60947|nr:DMT family transporter [Inediibacterium massiliense]
MKKKTLYADLALLIVAFIWGSTFVVIKDVLSQTKPMGLMAMRFIVATALLSIIFHKKLKKITKEEFVGGVVIGIFLYIALAVQTIGLIYTTAAKQSFLTTIYVVMVPFLTWIIYKKRPDMYSMIGAFLAIIGIGLLTIDESFSLSTLNKGDILTLSCALFFAFHIVAIEYFSKDKEPIVLSIVQFGVAAILFLVSALIFEPFTLNLNPSVMKAMLYLALAGTVFAYTIQNVAQKYTEASHTAIILSLESVFGSLLAVLVLGETLTMKMMLGCIVIFSGVILTETKLEFLKMGKVKKYS